MYCFDTLSFSSSSAPVKIIKRLDVLQYNVLVVKIREVLNNMMVSKFNLFLDQLFFKGCKVLNIVPESFEINTKLPN